MGIIKKLFEVKEQADLDDISMDQFRERQELAESRYSLRRTNFHPTMDQRLLYFHEDSLRHNEMGGTHPTH